MSGLAAPLHAAGIVGMSLLMLAAGSSKLRRRVGHARVIDAYALLPAGAGRWLAPLLGALECAVGAALWLPALRSCAAATLFALLLLYSGAIALNLLRGRRDIDCGCGGSRWHVPLSGWLLVRNALLLLVALALFAAPGTLPHGARDWLAALAIAGLAALAYNGLGFLLARDALLQDD